MTTYNDNFKTFLDRTNRRRINSRVSTILIEQCKKDENYASISMLDNLVNTSSNMNNVNSCNSRKKFDQNAIAHRQAKMNI